MALYMTSLIRYMYKYPLYITSPQHAHSTYIVNITLTPHIATLINNNYSLQHHCYGFAFYTMLLSTCRDPHRHNLVFPSTPCSPPSRPISDFTIVNYHTPLSSPSNSMTPSLSIAPIFPSQTDIPKSPTISMHRKHDSPNLQYSYPLLHFPQSKFIQILRTTNHIKFKHTTYMTPFYLAAFHNKVAHIHPSIALSQ